MRLTKTMAVVMAAAVVLSVAAVAFGIEVWLNPEEPRVEGGVVLQSSLGELVVRCISPQTSLTLDGFTGKVTFVNCFNGSSVEGLQGEVTRTGTNISVELDDARGTCEVKSPQKDDFSFAVLGDSQGHNDVLATLLNMTDGCDFVIHCGDLVPSGRQSEYVVLEETLNTSGIPVMTTPGNHDVRENGSQEYTERFGPTRYSFEYFGVTFAFIDSSDMNVSEDDLEWMDEVFESATHKVIVTHGTSYDPFEENHTLDAGSCDRLQEFALEEHVDAVFSGHVHAYSRLVVEGTSFFITGGAGGSLTDGTHHFLKASFEAGAFSYQKIDLEEDIQPVTNLVVKGHGLTVNLSFSQLFEMNQVSGTSSYENLYGNIQGLGFYSGVAVSVLVDLVGGMTSEETLRVVSADGYEQEFGYLNVYPDAQWLGLQGAMILALEFDGTETPDWQDGPRIAMMPDDGLYGNSDCELTSYPGQGYDVYPSAGARWARNVVELVIEG